MSTSVPKPGPAPSQPDHEGRLLGELRSARRRRAVRLIVVAVIVAVVITFIVRNSQTVQVDLLVAHRHPRLIWVILSSFVLGGIVGFMASGPGRRRHRSKDPSRH